MKLLLLLLICILSVQAIDYLDHVTTNNSDNFMLEGFRNDTIYSLDGNSRIMMQRGNLVLTSRETITSNWNIKWQTNTDTYSERSPSHLAIQIDGNLVIYSMGAAVWHSYAPFISRKIQYNHKNFIMSNTKGNTWQGCCGDYMFVVNDGGYAYLLDETQNVIWSTNSNAQTYPTYAVLPTRFPTKSPNHTRTISNANNANAKSYKSTNK